MVRTLEDLVPVEILELELEEMTEVAVDNLFRSVLEMPVSVFLYVVPIVVDAVVAAANARSSSSKIMHRIAHF